MPTRSVAQGFEEFHKRLVTSTTESKAAQSHRAPIKACLQAKFGMLDFFRSGSFGNATNIRNYSDVDYFASIPTKNLKADSSNTLREVADALRYRFPTTSGIRVDSPAVVVPFGTDASEAHEIIPADLVRNTSGKPRVYEIADSNGGWMRSSPDAHNAYVRSVDKKLDSMVKPLIRFLKAWKYYRNVPISSFYLELIVAEYAAGESSIIYSYDVRDVFAKMFNSRLAAMDDPAGESGSVSPCKTSLQKQDALKKVETALGRARKARESESEDDISGAFYWWDLLFDDEFPAYYHY